jgi:hypothetical protein
MQVVPQRRMAGPGVEVRQLQREDNTNGTSPTLIRRETRRQRDDRRQLEAMTHLE